MVKHSDKDDGKWMCGSAVCAALGETRNSVLKLAARRMLRTWSIPGGSLRFLAADVKRIAAERAAAARAPLWVPDRTTNESTAV